MRDLDRFRQAPDAPHTGYAVAILAAAAAQGYDRRACPETHLR